MRLTFTRVYVQLLIVWLGGIVTGLALRILFN